MTRFVHVALALVLAVPFAVFAAPRAEGATSNVHISGFAFNPSSVTVAIGDSVKWDNQDMVTHTVTADDLSFDSGNLATGATFTQTFTTFGTFAYHCKIHTTMKGTVIVVDPNALPDLVVSSIASTETFPGLATSVTVTVANVGANTAAASTMSLFYVYNGMRHAIGDAATPSLNVGASATATLTWSTAGKLGTFQIVASADSAHVVPESNESNNERTALASVLVSGVNGVDLTDP
ncbi:MAG: CARDB domain-containing protein [Thermoplasmatota archaeon]